MEQEIRVITPSIGPPKRRRRRANKRQRFHLVETLQANLDIARATKLGITANAKVLDFWMKLTAELNSMGKKCPRTVTEWQYVWALWYKKLRSKCRRITASLESTDGPTTTTEEHLNEIEIKILDIISRIENNQSEAGSNREKEKQIPHSISSPSESEDFTSFSYQIENKQEEMASSVKSRKRTSMKITSPSQGLKVECRVCLQYVFYENQCCEMFSPWNQNPKATIASYYMQVTNIQVTPADRCTKYICFKCLGLLQNCVMFIERAHHSETKLQMQYQISINVSSESLWPKPIQVDKCLNNDNKIEIEVKQEVLSEEEASMMETDNEELKMDIKVEPEEYASYCSPQIMDTISIMPVLEDKSMDNTDLNGYYEDEHYLEEHIKEEPLSDDESEVTLDLPLDCMLCTKTFNFVSGLKAHVIAQHSYLTIGRTPEVRPPVHQCCRCKRTFVTHTDLIVHETCHGQFACYMCNSKFDSFLLLTKHRKRCRNNGDHVSRLKTLDDVKRPSPDPQHTKIANSINKVLESKKINDAKAADSTSKESQSQNKEKIVDFNIQDNFQGGTVIEITFDNSPQDSNSPNSNESIIEENNANSELNNANSEDNNANSEDNNADSEENNSNFEVNNLDDVNKHNSRNIPNSELNNSNSVLDNSNSDINNPNSNQDLDQTPMDDAHIEIVTESKDLNQPVPETNNKKISNGLNQRQSLKRNKVNSTCTKLVSACAEMASHNDMEVFNSDLVSDNSNSVSKNSDSVSKNSNSETNDRESVLEVNNAKPVVECAKSLELSEHSKENTPSDSMKIHLSIHSLEKKSLDDLNNKQIDEEMIETPESNEDKVLQ